MKLFIAAAAAAVLSFGVSTPALAGQPIIPPTQNRVSATIDSAMVYVDRMPCAGPCQRKSVIVLTLSLGCHVKPTARVVSVTGTTVMVRATAVNTRGPRLCSTEPQRVTVRVTGTVNIVIDAATGQAVETTVSSTF